MPRRKFCALLLASFLFAQITVLHLSPSSAFAQSAVSVRLRSDTSDDNFSLGTIKFDGTIFSLPATIQKEVGNYRAEAFPPAGYEFKEWQPIGSNIFIDSRYLTSQSVIVSVSAGDSVVLEMELSPSPPPPPPPVPIRLRSDTSDDNFSLGTITFDGTSYSLPTTIDKESGNYRAVANPPEGYDFDRWEGIGSNILVEDPESESTIVGIGEGGSVILEMELTPAPETVAVRLRSDTSDDNFGLGSIRFDGTSYTLPVTIDKEPGNYRVEAFPPDGYDFVEWQPIGSNIFIDSRYLTSQSVIVSVSAGDSVVLEMELDPVPPPPQDAELVPSELNLAGGVSKAGSNQDFYCTVRNTGLGDSGDFYVDFMVDGVLIERVGPDDVPASSEEEFGTSGAWTAVKGAHTVACVVDSTGAVSEPNESNNRGSYDFEVDETTPFAFSVSVSPRSQTVEPGKAATATITLGLVSGESKIIALSCSDVPMEQGTCVLNGSKSQILARVPSEVSLKIQTASGLTTSGFTARITAADGPTTKSAQLSVMATGPTKWQRPVEIADYEVSPKYGAVGENVMHTIRVFNPDRADTTVKAVLNIWASGAFDSRTVESGPVSIRSGDTAALLVVDSGSMMVTPGAYEVDVEVSQKRPDGTWQVTAKKEMGYRFMLDDGNSYAEGLQFPGGRAYHYHIDDKDMWASGAAEYNVATLALAVVSVAGDAKEAGSAALKAKQAASVTLNAMDANSAAIAAAEIRKLNLEAFYETAILALDSIQEYDTIHSTKSNLERFDMTYFEFGPSVIIFMGIDPLDIQYAFEDWDKLQEMEIDDIIEKMSNFNTLPVPGPKLETFRYPSLEILQYEQPWHMISLTEPDTQRKLYLHLYDSSGRHTGMNMVTHVPEEGIPGSKYASWASQETVLVPANYTEYSMVVDASQSQARTETYDVSVFQTGPDSVEKQAQSAGSIEKGSTKRYQVSLIEAPSVSSAQNVATGQGTVKISEEGKDNQAPFGGQCLIATAAFGSEISPQVQFLREFRDQRILSTSAGSAFMAAFNGWYYSFSPYVADYERDQPLAKESIKVAIYPLLAILTISEGAYSAIPGEPGALFAGAAASGMIGAVYLWPAGLLVAKSRSVRKVIYGLLVSIGITIVAIIASLASGSSTGLLLTTAIFVIGLASSGAMAAATGLLMLIMHAKKNRQSS